MKLAPSLEMIGVLCTSTILSALGTMLIVRRKGSLGLDRPDERRKQHAHVVSRLGGLPIFITLMIGFGAAIWKLPEMFDRWWPVILTNIIVFGIGFADDLKPLGAKVKFFVQISAACLLFFFGVEIGELTNPFTGGVIDLGGWSFPLTVVWLVAIPNLINLIDGMDGLAGGFGMFLCLTLAFVGHYNGKPDTVFVTVAMSGALAGFLFFNFPPAKIFLGDGGAYLIGFFIASASLVNSQKGSVMAALLVMVLALGVPILDTLFAIVRRAIRGVPVFRADAEHIHHRLMLIGFSKTRALIAMYSVTAVLSLLGIAIFLRRGLALPIAGSVLALLAIFSVRYLGYVKSWSRLRAQLREGMKRRREMLYAQLHGRVVEWESERCSSAAEFVELLKHSLSRIRLSLEPSEQSRSLQLHLMKGKSCRLFAPKFGDDAREWWLARADAFVPGINHALERWGDLPGLEVSDRPPEEKIKPEHAPATPSL